MHLYHSLNTLLKRCNQIAKFRTLFVKHCSISKNYSAIMNVPADTTSSIDFDSLWQAYNCDLIDVNGFLEQVSVQNYTLTRTTKNAQELKKVVAIVFNNQLLLAVKKGEIKKAIALTTPSIPSSRFNNDNFERIEFINIFTKVIKAISWLRFTDKINNDGMKAVVYGLTDFSATRFASEFLVLDRLFTEDDNKYNEAVEQVF